MKLLVLDGNSIVNRAFYGIKPLTTKEGLFTNAIYGFMNILFKLEQEEKPDEIAIAFDLRAPTFRHKLYDGYKAQRKGMPEELAMQMPLLKELLQSLGYRLVSLEGYEADDILGTLAKTAAQRGDACVLATGDRDSLQLVQEHVQVLLATTRMGRSETKRMDEAAILERYGVRPLQLIETKALMGDASDNIPGVAGVGEKTAFALIQRFGSLDGVYEHLDDDAIKPGVRKKLEADKDSAYMSYKLAVICCEVPIETARGHYEKSEPDKEQATALLSRLEMYSVLERLQWKPDFSLDKSQNQTLAQKEVQPLPENLAGLVFMAPVENGWLITKADTQSVYFAEETSPALLALLQNKNAYKRVFDSKPLHKLVLSRPGNARVASLQFDAKLAAYLLNPAAHEYTIEHLAAEYRVSPSYSCEPHPFAPLLEPLYRKLSAECDKAGMKKLLVDMEQPLAEVLASMELYGIALDADGVRRFGEELQAEIQTQLHAVFEVVGYEFNLNSPKQLAEALFEKLGLPPGKKTKSGYSTDAETLEGLRAHSPVIEHILTYRLYAKLNSTYVEGLLKVVDDDGRVRSTFNQTETRTGRLSSGEPNLQNIPVRTQLGSRLRAYFMAGEDMLLCDADYSQIELRILAAISGDEAMQEAFRKGEDIHRTTAASVNGLPPDMVTPALRSAAKAVNFGIVYGIGAFSLSKDIGVSVKEADEFIKTYLNTFPGVRRYMEDSVAFGKEHGYVETLFGRRRPLPELSGGNHNIRALGERIAMNTPIQGAAADIIKIAMVRVFSRLHAEGLRSRLILQVHDELIVETVHGEEKQVAALLQEEMQSAVALAVPMVAEVHCGKNWLEAKG